MSELETHESPNQVNNRHGNGLGHNHNHGLGHTQNEDKISRVVHDDDFIHFGDERYLKSDFAAAFGGTMNAGGAPVAQNDLANPAPLGLSAFALTTFVLSMVNVEARGVVIPNIVVGLAFFYGGAAQFVAGMFELGCGNTFGAVALSSYAGFWCSYGALQVKSFGIAAAYEGNEKELEYAIGIFLIGWFIFTFFLCVMTLKSTLAFFLLFFFLSITFLLLAISEMTTAHKVGIKKAGGVFGLLTAFVAWYNAYAGLANSQNSYVTVKAVSLPDFQSKKV